MATIQPASVMGADPNLLGIRDTLNNKFNISNERIGWDGEYVTIDGNKSIRPQQNIGGTTYADQSAIAQAAQPFQQVKTMTQPQTQMSNMMSPAAATTPAQPPVTQQFGDIMGELAAWFPQSNPYDQEMAEMLDILRGRVSNPQRMTIEQVMATPEYLAQQAQTQRGAQQATRQAQEALGEAGFGRSTRLQDRAQAIEFDALDFLMNQAAPGIRQQYQSEADRQTAALMELMDFIGREKAAEDARKHNQFMQGMELLGFKTGREDVAQAQANYENTFNRGAFESDRLFGLEEGKAAWDRDPNNPLNQGRILQNQISALTLQYLPEQMKLEIEGLQQDLETGKIDQQEALYRLNELADPNSISNQIQALSLEAGRLGNQKLKKEIEQIGKTPALTPYEQEMQQIRLESAKIELEQLRNKPNQNDVDFENERRGLAEAIRTGQMTPGTALQQIEEDQQLGFYTPQQADLLKQDLQTLKNAAPSPAPTPEQNMAAEDYLANIPNDRDIEAEARQFGYPLLDYRAYYKDPKGKMSGITFGRWNTLYGPKLSAR